MRRIMIIVDRATGELSHYTVTNVKMSRDLKDSIYIEEFVRSFPLSKIFSTVSIDDYKRDEYLETQRSYDPKLGIVGVYEITNQALFDKLKNEKPEPIEKRKKEKKAVSSTSVNPFVVLKPNKGIIFQLDPWKEFNTSEEAMKFLKDIEYEQVAFFKQQHYWLYIHDSDGFAILYIRPEGRK
jgi:hypothetical protein